MCSSYFYISTIWCEFHDPGSFAPGHKDPGFILQYLWKKLSITSLFSIQIMSYLGTLEIIYSHVIDSLISGILKTNCGSLRPGAKDPRPSDSHRWFFNNLPKGNCWVIYVIGILWRTFFCYCQLQHKSWISNL